MGKIIAVTNQKGGVGKTTTSLNLAASLGFLGAKVLIIDADAQGNATTGAGVAKENIAHSLYDTLIGDVPFKEIIIQDVFNNVDLAPATISLAGAEAYFLQMHNNKQNILAQLLKPIYRNYDFIFIDCPPSLGLINRNVLGAADTVLIPLQVEYYALEGLAQLLSSIRFVQKMHNPLLGIEGILLTMFDSRTNLSSEVMQEVQKYFKEKVYQTYIPRNVKVSEAPSFGESIISYDKRGAGSLAYMELAKEFLRNNGK